MSTLTVRDFQAGVIPPPPGTHTTRSHLVLGKSYLKAAGIKNAASCGVCHKLEGIQHMRFSGASYYEGTSAIPLAGSWTIFAAGLVLLALSTTVWRRAWSSF